MKKEISRKLPNDTAAPAGLTVKEAGHRGGIVTRDRHAAEGFYRRIGAKGGRKTAELYHDLLAEFGRKGGRPRRPALDESMGEEGQ